jgi:hypothetical protein
LKELREKNDKNRGGEKREENKAVLADSQPLHVLSPMKVYKLVILYIGPSRTTT